VNLLLRPHVMKDECVNLFPRPYAMKDKCTSLISRPYTLEYMDVTIKYLSKAN